MTEETTFKFNNDGSIDIPVDNKPVRFVKESDLLAVKGGAESKVKEWETKETQFNTSLAEANRLRDEEHQNLLKTQAAHEQLKSTHSDYDTLKTKVGELEKENGSHKESIGKHETELANRIRYNLITFHSVTEESLKGKDLSQLRNIEEAAKILGPGKKGGPANYDGGGGPPGGGSAPEKPIDRAHRILEEHEAKGHRIGARASAVIK